MKRFLKLNIFLKIFIIILLGGIIIFGYSSYKKNEVKSAVEDYLYQELALSKDDVMEVTPNTSKLPGQKRWLVYVKLKDDPKGYFYYKNNKNKVVLESYVLDGTEYLIDK